MVVLTYLNPDTIKDGSILISKIESSVASKSYVDEAIASAIITTLNTEV